MPPRPRKRSVAAAASATAAASAATPASSTASAPATAASNAAIAAATAPHAASSALDSSDSESDTDEEFVDGDHLNISGFIQSAQQNRVKPITRRGYEGYYRKMALWASSLDQFKGCVSASGSIITPLDPDAMVGFTEHLKARQVNWPHHPVAGTKKHMAPKTITNFFAAAKDTYARHGQQFPPEIDTYFSNFYRSYVLFIAEQKDLKLYPDNTNSVGFSFGVYERICRKASQYIQNGKGMCMTSWRYVWLFFVFLFNLMGRRERITRVRYSWIRWQDDCMMVKVPTQKGDQEGTLSYWKRVYANAKCPWLCAITALAVEVFSVTPADEFRDLIFHSSGGSSLQHFQTFLRWAFDDGKLDGVPLSRITGHSPKRSAICLVSGCEVVKWDACELRADHRIGLTSVYQTCAAPQQDGIMGRLLAGLPFGTETFNIAPPHFRPAIIAGIPFQEFVAHYDSYNAEFRSVIPFLLASIMHHLKSGQLQHLLPAFHPFWSSTLYMRHKKLMKQLQSEVLGGTPGADSILPVSGNSVVGDIRIDVAAIRPVVNAIRDDVAALRACCGKNSNDQFAVGASPIVNPKSACELLDMRDDLRHIRRRLDEIASYSVTSAPAAGAVLDRRCVPVLYLANSFVLASYTPFNLFTRWFSADPPAPALRHIRNEMLPRTAGRRLQENVLSTYRKFMEAFLGRSPDVATIELDMATAFAAAWTRLRRMYGWDRPTVTGCDNDHSAERAVKTVYGWLLKEPILLKQLIEEKIDFAQPGSAVRDVVLRQEILEILDRRDAAAAVLVHPAPVQPSPVSPALVACVPRLAILYNGPRPLNPRRAYEDAAAHDHVDEVIASHAPRVGARPCWPCPFCLIFCFFESKHHLFRHVRERHQEEYRNEAMQPLWYNNADDVTLIWCFRGMAKGKRDGKWEALRGLQ